MKAIHIFFIFVIIIINFNAIADSKVIVPHNYYLVSFIEDEKFGFIDTAGNIHIKAMYIEALDFVNGLCPVKTQKGEWIFIDKYNVKVWKDKEFRSAGNFSCGFAKILQMDSNYWTFTDLKGEINKNEYIAVKDFKDNICAVSEDGNGWKFIDRDFKNITDDLYFDCGNFNDGVVAVYDESDSCYKYLNKEGKTILALPATEYYAVSQFIDGIACVNYKGKWGFINKAGEFVIKPQFEVAMPFFEGMAAVRSGGKWGYIKENGEFHIKPFIEDTPDFYAGYLNEYKKLDKLQPDSVNFFGNKKTRKKKDIIPIIIDFEPSLIVLRYSQGLSVYNSYVRNSIKYGYMDRAGRKIISPLYNKAFPFKNEIAKIIDSDNMLFIDKKGKKLFNRRFRQKNK